MAQKREPKDTPTKRWFKAIRAAYGLNQDGLAPVVNRGRSSVSGYENGNPIPDDVILTLLREFPDVPPPKEIPLPQGIEKPVAKQILGDAAYIYAPPFREIRYAGEVPATTWGDPLSADTTFDGDSKYAGVRRFETKVIGDSCWPALRQGDRAIWESDYNPPHRKIVLAERYEDDGCTVKQLTYDPKDGRDLLKPINPRFDPPPNGNGWRATARLIGVIRLSNGAERTWYKPEGLEPRDLLEDSNE